MLDISIVKAGEKKESRRNKAGKEKPTRPSFLRGFLCSGLVFSRTLKQKVCKQTDRRKHSRRQERHNSPLDLQKELKGNCSGATDSHAPRGVFARRCINAHAVIDSSAKIAEAWYRRKGCDEVERGSLIGKEQYYAPRRKKGKRNNQKILFTAEYSF